MREIETQPVGGDEGAFLRHVITEHLAQRFVQEMRGRMIPADVIPTVMVNIQPDGVTDLQPVMFNLDVVHKQVAGLFVGRKNLCDRSTVGGSLDPACVTNLSAGLGVKRRLIEDHFAAFARL
jgi:hypothetical protein